MFNKASPISEHPESEIPDLFVGQHVQQMRGIREVNIVIPAAVHEQVVDLVKSGHVRNGCVDVSSRIQFWQIHVPLGIYGVC